MEAFRCSIVCNHAQVRDCGDGDAAKLAQPFAVLQQLRLERPRLTDDGWNYFGQLSRLSRLQITEANDATLAHIAKWMTQLQELTLDAFNGVEATDGGLLNVSLLRELRDLRIYDADHITDAGARCLTALTALQRLSLSTSSHGVTNGTLNNLSQLPLISFCFIHYSAEQIADAALDCISRMPLERLELRLFGAAKISQVDASHLSRCDSLRHLTLAGEWLTDLTLESIQLSALTRLELVQCANLQDECFKHVSRLSALQELRLECLGVGNAGLAHLSSCSLLRRLEMISLWGITSGAFQLVAQLHKLQALVVNACEHVFDNALAWISQSPSLLELQLFDMNITDVGLMQLARLSCLQQLQLKGFLGVTGAALAHLVGLPSLRRLEFWDFSISDADVSHLLRMPALREVRVGPAHRLSDVAHTRIRHLLV